MSANASIVTLALIWLLPSGLLGQRLSFSERPILQIGYEDPGLADIPGVVWATRMPDGRIVVAGQSRIVIYSADGSKSATMAAPGEGPGELRVVGWAGRRTDSLFTFDMALSRLTAFTIGAPPQSARFLPASGSGGKVVVGRLGTGGLVLQSISAPPRAHADGPFRDSTQLWLVEPPFTGAPKAISPALPGISWVALNPPGGGRTNFGIDALRPRTSVVVSGSLVWVGDPMSDVVVAYQVDGKVAYQVKLPWPRAQLTLAQHEALRGEAMRRAREEARPLTAAMFERRLSVASVPRMNRLIPAESNGEVWVESYAPGSAIPPSYALVGKDGHIRTVIRGPAGVRFFEITSQFAIGTTRTSDDIGALVIYRLEQASR